MTPTATPAEPQGRTWLKCRLPGGPVLYFLLKLPSVWVRGN